MRLGWEKILRNAEVEIEYHNDFLEELQNTKETAKLRRAWSGLLGHYVNSVSAMRRATDAGPSKKWSDKLYPDQKRDPILQYAKVARDADVHVFEEERRVVHRAVTFGSILSVSGNVNVIFDRNTLIGNDGISRRLPDFSLKVEDGRVAKSSIPKAAFQEKCHYIELRSIKSRDGAVYQVPNPHVLPELQAIEIGRHTGRWIQARFREACDLAR
ncbi:hypothetical protein [Paracoccus sp. 22332]|uniref:hypothetical protein n=1 Tax=Paracoccus sp. 22332 TaxID=3453913 RepID=UPI003F84A251